MIVVPTAYFGNIEYYRWLLSGDDVCVELHEHFPKQTYRNRSIIMSANGVIPLIVPLSRSRGGKCPTVDIAIDYSMPWQRNAWRAIVSAYRNAPYFDHFEEDIKRFFDVRYSSLVELNSDILETTLKLIGVEKDVRYSKEYISPNMLIDGDVDVRDSFTPKKVSDAVFKPYYQVFGDRLPFAANISILDLLFCEGNYSKGYIL